MDFRLAEATAALGAAPATFDALIRGLPGAWMDEREGPDTWSPRDVIAHLADLEDADWMVRVNHILREPETSPFTPVDRVRFQERLAGLNVEQLLQLFAGRRTGNLKALENRGLSEADLARRGLHPALGPVTLEQLLATWVVHDLTHMAQIVRVAAKQYDTAVGPWKAYLSVLTR